MASYIERPRTTCALGGAIAAANALPRVSVITHTAIGCGGNLSSTIAGCGGNLGEGCYSGTSLPSSAVGEREIVFGGADRLTEEIKTTLEVIDADLFVVATGCMTEMIGDDVKAVVQEFEDSRVPVIAISTPSFKGDAYAGYEILMNGIFNEYLPPAKEEEKDPALVNIFGIVPAFDPFFRGDLEEIKRLLEALGLKVNTFFTPNQTFENIKSAPGAALNISFSHVWGTDFVKKFSSRNNMPYWVSDLPIGAVATETFLRNLSEHITVPKERLEALIERENERYYSYFVRTADLIANRQFYFYSATVTNSNYAIPLGSFLSQEMGWHVEHAFVTDVLKQARKKRLKEGYAAANLPGELIFDTDTQRIGRTLAASRPRGNGKRYFDAKGPFYIVGSSLDRENAAALGAQILTVSYPIANRLVTDRGYAGYNGALRLTEDLIGALL